jgi:hypothetical protein
MLDLTCGETGWARREIEMETMRTNSLQLFHPGPRNPER